VRSNVMRPGAATGKPKLAPAGATAPTARSPQGARQRAVQRAKQARGGMKRPGLSLNSQRRGDRQRSRAAVAASQRHRSATAARRQRHCNATATRRQRDGNGTQPMGGGRPGPTQNPAGPLPHLRRRPGANSHAKLTELAETSTRSTTAPGGDALQAGTCTKLKGVDGSTSATLISSRRSWSRCWSSP
jgi:hypothetical protein